MDRLEDVLLKHHPLIPAVGIDLGEHLLHRRGDFLRSVDDYLATTAAPIGRFEATGELKLALLLTLFDRADDARVVGVIHHNARCDSARINRFGKEPELAFVSRAINDVLHGADEGDAAAP